MKVQMIVYPTADLHVEWLEFELEQRGVHVLFSHEEDESQKFVNLNVKTKLICDYHLSLHDEIIDFLSNNNPDIVHAYRII